MVRKKRCEAKEFEQQVNNEMLKTTKTAKMMKMVETTTISSAKWNLEVEREERKVQK